MANLPFTATFFTLWRTHFSISLEKPPLLNVFPAHYNILYFTTPCYPNPKIWGSRPPSPPGLTPMARGWFTCGQLWNRGKGKEPCGCLQDGIFCFIILICFADILHE